MTHLVEVAFGGNRKAFYLWDGDAPPPLHAAVIVEADRGEDLGRVHAVGELAERRCTGCSHGCGSAARPTERALRLANADDVARAASLRDDNEAARRATHERARAASLPMKISDAEWQWDRRKLTIFFTADRRVDFRHLVRDLASHFRTRIELRQIGVRDEAKRLSGVGRCGREYCSASWLPELRPVNLGVAKDQRLSLNPTQISGACGRLMCCLRYEHDFYVQSRRRFPKEGRLLRTARGEEQVVAIDIFRDTVTLRAADGETRVAALAALRAEAEHAGQVGLLGGGDRVAVAEPPGAEASDTEASDTEASDTEASDTEVPGAEASGAEASIASAPADEAPDEPTLETDDAGADEDEAPTEEGPGGEATADDAAADEANPSAPPRKRRRGRRGGRRARGEPRARGDRPADGDTAPPASPPAPDA